jgi:hypothetical protein
VKLGYSFWGFLGPGITDTPDGGRSHRRSLIDGMAAAGHRAVFLQDNRDLADAGHDLRHRYDWDAGLPGIDALFLEWRWPVPGRNTTACGTPGHTCELHRQDELVARYTISQQVPTIVWDKDLQLPAGSPLRRLRNVAVCEAALSPSPGAESCCFPSPTPTLTGRTPPPWPRFPGRCRWFTSATSTTARRRSPGSSRRPPPATTIAWPGNGLGRRTGRA